MTYYVTTKTIRYNKEGERVEGREVKLNMDTAWYVMEHGKDMLFVVYSENNEGNPHGVLVEAFDCFLHGVKYA